MNIAVFGGSFNPPHYSHFLAITWALCSGEVEQVWMLPCYQHAFGKQLLPFQHRLHMCSIVAELVSPNKIKVLPVEKEIEKSPTYTIDTLQFLTQKYPTHQFRLLVGTDILDEKHAWKDFDMVEQLAPLLVVPRTSPKESHPCLPSISSTQIRERLKTGKDLSFFLPPPIHQYILQHSLFQEVQGNGHLSI